MSRRSFAGFGAVRFALSGRTRPFPKTMLCDQSELALAGPRFYQVFAIQSIDSSSGVPVRVSRGPRSGFLSIVSINRHISRAA